MYLNIAIGVLNLYTVAYPVGGGKWAEYFSWLLLLYPRGTINNTEKTVH